MTTRRLAAVLAADVVGFSSMMERNEEGTLARLKALQRDLLEPRVSAHHGRVVKTTGDGMLATFDGPARALYCAAAIRRAANRAGLHMRAGAHVGEVELVGRDVRGVAVHEAARIMGAAAEDEILVSDLTRVLAAGAGVDFEDHSQEALKGLDGEWRLSRLLLDSAPAGS